MNKLLNVSIFATAVFLLAGCVNQQQLNANPQSTTSEPLFIKFGGFKERALEVAVPLKIEKKKTRGYRSPVELRLKVLMTNWEVINIPLMPVGAVGGLRFRW